MSIQVQKQKPLLINFKELMPELSKRNRATHYIHKYPAKLIPHIPNYLINKYTQEKDMILDPFCGSGTTLLESILCNRHAFGIELNPIGRLISQVKTTPLNIVELKDVSHDCYELIKDCTNPIIPEFENRDLWFTKKTQKELAKIKSSIDALCTTDDIRNFFLVCFSSIIFKVSNAEPRDIMPKLSKNPIQHNVLNEFLRQLDFNIARITELENVKTKSRLIGENAKKINLNCRVNMIITSPPYLSAMQYFRTTKLEYYWLRNGEVKQYRELARQSIHGELSSGVYKKLQFINIPEIDNFILKIYKKSPQYGLKVSMYFSEMNKILQKLFGVLHNDGYLAMIIGNSKILEQRAPLNSFIVKMGEQIGFEFQLELLDAIKFHRLGIKRSNKTNRIYNEHVILLKKS